MDRPQLSRLGQRHHEASTKSLFKTFPSFQTRDNPQAVVNFGVAESSLCHPELVEYFNSIFKLSEFDLTYGDAMHGSKRLQNALAHLFNDRFDPLVPVEPEHLICGAGLSAMCAAHCSPTDARSIDQLATLLANPGDCFLTAAPFYNGFEVDVSARAGVSIVGVPTSDLNDVALLKAFDAKIDELKRSGGPTPRAIIVTNPGNPISTILPDQVLLEYCRIAQRHNLHLISDEIYALGVFPSSDYPTKPQFRSLLSFDVAKEANCDPSRVHVVYGMSKDFGSKSASRILANVCRQRTSTRLLRLSAQHRAPGGMVALLHPPSSAADLLWSSLLDDKPKLDWYLELNETKLTAAYERATAFLRQWHISYSPACSGHFIWADFRRYLKTTSEEGEQELFDAFMAADLFIAPGKNYKAPQSGFFRLTFTLADWQAEIGFARLSKVLEARSKLSGRSSSSS